MKPATTPTPTPSTPTLSKPTTPTLSTRSRQGVHLVFAAAGWALLILAVLLTSLVVGWVLLAAVLLHSGPTGAQPVILILVVLLAVTGGLAWLVAKYFASARNVGLAVGLILVLLSVAGATWALSSPDQALFLARQMAWDGSDIWDYQKYPQRAINNAPPAFHFQQNLSPQLFQTIEYQQEGQLKQASFDEFLKSTQTTSFIVIKDDAILYEGYANGFTRDSIVQSFSIAKSVTSALVGIAIDEGAIKSVDDPIITYLPELRGKGHDGVTLRHLLTMSSGIRFVHKAELPPLLRPLPINDDTRTTSFPNLRSQALSVKPDGETPGAAFNYNKYYPQLLGMILERTTHRPVSEYLQEKIWKPLGMEYPASWSLDSQESGFERMEGDLYGRGRAIDFAKFGALFLNNGNWNGRQIIPERWVTESTSPDPDDNRPWRVATDWKAANGYYKYMWWGLRRPDGSYVYMARGGLQQQWIYVSPKDRVVIVRFGFVEGGGIGGPMSSRV